MKFSSRLDWDAPPNPLTKLLVRKRAAGIALIDLTESNPTRAGFRYPEPEILAAFSDPRCLIYEPAPAGHAGARQEVANYYARRGFTVDPARILLTASTSEAYSYIFKLLCDPGDRVLVPRPSYPLFEFLASLEGIDSAQYPLRYHDGWAIDFDSLDAALTPRTRCLVLVNPNNPTGSYLKRGEFERLCLAGTGGPPTGRLALVSDEVFSDYALGPDPHRIATLAEQTQALSFSLGGLSKIAGLPQMKLGWIAIGGPPALAAQAFERLEWIADTYLSVATPVQHALPRLLESGEAVRRQIAARVQGNLTTLRGLAKGSSVTILDVEGGWYAPARIPRTRSEEAWALDLLEHRDVLVQPGFFYDFESEAFLVLSLLPEPAMFQEGAARVIEFVCGR